MIKESLFGIKRSWFPF